MTDDERILQIRRSLKSSCPDMAENPSWYHTHNDCMFLLKMLDERAEKPDHAPSDGIREAINYFEEKVIPAYELWDYFRKSLLILISAASTSQKRIDELECDVNDLTIACQARDIVIGSFDKHEKDELREEITRLKSQFAAADEMEKALEDMRSNFSADAEDNYYQDQKNACESADDSLVKYRAQKGLKNE